MVSIEIYFHDLTKDAQQNLLKIFQTSPEDENWEVIPLAIIEMELKISDEKSNR